MNRLLLLISLLLSCSGSFSQNQIYREEYNLSTGIKADSPSPSKTLSYFSDGVVYSVSTQATLYSNSIKITAFDAFIRKARTLTIKRTSELKKLFENQLEAIAYQNGKLILIAFNRIYIFVSKNETEYKLNKIIDNNGSFCNIYPLNKDELLFYVNYQFHPLDEDHPHTWAKFFSKNDSLSNERYFGDENLRFSSLPNQWVSAFKGMVAYANTTEYKIRFYNSDFDIIDSISNDLLKENAANLYSIPDGTEYSLEEIKRIGDADDTLLTRIEKIFLLDSTHILAIIKQPKTHFLRYDLWNKKNTAWTRLKFQSLPGHYENGVEYSKANNSVTGFYGDYSGLTYAGNGYFYFVYYPFIENPVSKKFDYQADYYDKVNELTTNKQLYYGIKKIKINYN